MSNTNLNYYLQSNLDGTLQLNVVPGTVENATFGPHGSYYTLLSQFMAFTPRPDRLPIRCLTHTDIMECIEAVTRLIGIKLHIFSSADAWFQDHYSILLGSGYTMIVISFLYAGDITELEVDLRLEGYLVNSIGIHA